MKRNSLILSILVVCFVFTQAYEDYSAEQLGAYFGQKLGLPVQHNTYDSYPPAQLLKEKQSLFKRPNVEIIFILPGVKEFNGLENVYYITESGVPALPLSSSGATLQDILYQLEENSLIVSQASKADSISNIVVHKDFLVKGHKQQPIASYYVRGEFRSFYKSDDDIVLTEADVKEELNGGTFGKFNGGILYVVVGDEEIELDTEEAGILQLVSELSQIRHTFKIIDQDLLKDHDTDLFLFAVEALQLIDITSPEFSAAILLTKNTIKYVKDKLSAITEGVSVDILIPDQYMYINKRDTLGAYSQYEFKNYYEPNNTNNTFDAAGFQIVLWSSVLLIVVVLATIWSLCTMDVGEDTLLYRTPLDIEMTQQRYKYD